jgi:hypothetical protein
LTLQTIANERRRMLLTYTQCIHCHKTFLIENGADPKKDLTECWECEPLSDEEKLEYDDGR